MIDSDLSRIMGYIDMRFALMDRNKSWKFSEWFAVVGLPIDSAIYYLQSLRFRIIF